MGLLRLRADRAARPPEDPLALKIHSYNTLIVAHNKGGCQSRNRTQRPLGRDPRVPRLRAAPAGSPALIGVVDNVAIDNSTKDFYAIEVVR